MDSYEKEGQEVKEHVVDDVPAPKLGRHGVILVPRPSDHPQDPLNWPTQKKLMTLFIAFLASFAGTIAGLANIAGYGVQAAVYHTTVVRVSYATTAAGVGLCVGPFFWAPLAKLWGTNFIIFWSMILSIVCNVWAICMTHPGDYASFVASRLLVTLFSSACTTVTANTVVGVFFLHDRGKAYAVWINGILLGSCAGGTFSGFIVQHTTWQVQFWYNVGLELFVIILCVLFLDETYFPREDPDVLSKIHRGIWGRLRVLVLPKKQMPTTNFRQYLSVAALPFKAFASPTVGLIGLSLMLSFTWSVGVNITLSIFLQTPVEAGGYGFTPQQNAFFSFTIWMGIAVAQLYGLVVNDRLPLWICKRWGGLWHPKYRLYPLTLTMTTEAIGLGVFGAAIQKHYHYMVAAFAVFLVVFSDTASVAPCNIYLVESIGTEVAIEAATVLSFCRVILGTFIPLFLFPWIQSVGVNWVFGTQAFMVLAACLILIGLVFFEKELRALDLVGTHGDDNVQVVSSSEDRAP